MHYGVGSVAIALIVSVYMFGLGIGSLLGGYLSETVNKRVLLYFVIEALLGLFGIASLSFLDFLGTYTAGTNYLISLGCIVCFLSFPTLLMGITLPLVTKIFNRMIGNFFNSISFLYFINTLGAATGSLFGSYIAITFTGLDGAIYFAVVINFILALLITLLSKTGIESSNKLVFPSASKTGAGELGRLAYILVFITGFLAIGYEITWFRIIGVLVKSSPYSFSTMLFVYLAGIALGSYCMDKYLGTFRNINRSALFFRLQFLIGVYVIIIFSAFYYLSSHAPFGLLIKASFNQPVHPPLPSYILSGLFLFSSWKTFVHGCFALLDIVFWPGFFIFVPTLLMGASFPLIAHLSLMNINKEGETVGRVYFFNVLGNVCGGVATGFILLPVLGTERILLIFSLIGISFLICAGRDVLRNNTAVVAVCWIIGILFFPGPGALYKSIHVAPRQEYSTYLEEGIEGVVVTYASGDRIHNYINGVGHGVRPGYSYYVESIMAVAHVPRVKNALVIGYGTGSIVEALMQDADIESITIVEINSTLICNLQKIPLFRSMLADQRVKLVFDDGRRFLIRSKDTFDLILLDPLHTTTAYSNNLYSRQFFALTSAHLSDGGVLSVWMDEHNVMPRTIATVFAHVKMFSLGWSDSFCLASDRPLISAAEKEKRILEGFSRQDQQHIRSLRLTSVELLGNREHILQYTNPLINEDLKPVCEYYVRPYDRWKMKHAHIKNTQKN